MDVEEEYIKNANLFSPGKHYHVVLNTTCGIMCNPIKLNHTNPSLLHPNGAHACTETPIFKADGKGPQSNLELY